MKKIIDLTTCRVDRKTALRFIFLLCTLVPEIGMCNSTIDLNNDSPVEIKQVNLDKGEFMSNSVRQRQRYHHQYILNLYSQPIGSTTYVCESHAPKNIVSAEDPRLSIPDIRLRYFEQAVEDIRACRPWVLFGSQIPPAHASDVKGWGIYYTDGYPEDVEQGYVTGVRLNITGFNEGTNPPLNDCVAHKLIDFKFGTVPLKLTSSPPRARGSIFLRCSKPTGVTIQINGGENLVNKDHSEIHFEYPQYVELEGDIPISVKPYAEMISPPAKPGSYLWSSPVVISFD
ncbi:hypothetical protein [Vibrio cholerae]|uniref:hypothetical protein n=1 Tax=Vibrio cholerae TaxID=666 RepID=UPI0018F0923F|nr:hypothetical protein [Vibrio cholerae]MBJ6887609.1 hypothetical protein [Vibrio cholerae]MBJ6907269.1 hypothetical protein [Vibrio cholerae]